VKAKEMERRTSHEFHAILHEQGTNIAALVAPVAEMVGEPVG